MIGRKRVIVPGAYISPKEEEELERLQKKKTFFMLLSTLFFALAIFMPAGIEGLTEYAIYLAVSVYLCGVVASVIVALLGKGRQKIQKAIESSQAPAKGYKVFTYTSYEMFCVVHVLLLAVQVYLCILSSTALMILSGVSMLVSLVFAIISRFIFVNANKDMEFVPTNPVISDDEQDEFYRTDNVSTDAMKESEGEEKL